MKPIEEKARAYDEVLQLMRDLYPTLKGEEKERAERLFPELKESEDERIRKAIIEYLKMRGQGSFAGYPMPTVLAWLEKQGEHADFRNKIQIGDKVTRNKDGVLVNLSQLKRVANKDENQGEQKPAWSEEDEACKNTILCAVQGNFVTEVALKQAIGWLKSLKDRYAWKPSEEQMADLWNIICECRPANHQLLQDIYYGLKTLRGE